MRSDLLDLLNTSDWLFHVSEEADIAVFKPRPSPSFFEEIDGDVVFAISGRLVHNYLLPRDCPRVTWYAGPQTTAEDKAAFLNNTMAEYVVAIESGWLKKINNTKLYVYAFEPDNFELIDECAGYHVSYNEVVPVQKWEIVDIIDELLGRNIELRIMPDLSLIADAIKGSTLRFSLIRMRNAKKVPF